MAQYQIDADMLGDDFNGDLGDIVDIIPILAKVTGRPESDFVARQHLSQYVGAEEPSDIEWFTVLSLFQKRHPELFDSSAYPTANR